MGDLSTSERFLYVLKQVLRSPASLAVWAAAIGAILMLPGFPGAYFAGLALILQGTLFFRALHNEEYLQKVFSARRDREEALTEAQIETLLERMDFETRQRMRYILQLQKEMAQESRGADVEAYARKDLDRISDGLAPLVKQAIKLAERRQKLTRYLHNVDERALKNYCNSVRQKIETTTDAVQKAQYEQALRAREAELQTYQSISQAVARIDSQLENVEATFASWKAMVIRIKTAEVGAATAASESLYNELDALSSEINLLDSSVSEALADQAPATLQQRP
jgi:type III secretory pathway component EscV